MNRKMLQSMMHSPVRNYIVPGLTSWLIGNPSPAGTVRLFTSERNQQEAVTPHSHRFDFQCKVISGTVVNRIWRSAFDGKGDLFALSRLTYSGNFGEYTKDPAGTKRFDFSDHSYSKDEWYEMNHQEIHSIHFSKGAEVLFLEGPERQATTVILEPFVGDELIPTFRVESWMFKREQ